LPRSPIRPPRSGSKLLGDVRFANLVISMQRVAVPMSTQESGERIATLCAARVATAYRTLHVPAAFAPIPRPGVDDVRRISISGREANIGAQNQPRYLGRINVSAAPRRFPARCFLG